MSDAPGQDVQQGPAEAVSSPAPANATATAPGYEEQITDADATPANNDVSMADAGGQDENASPAPSGAPQTASSNVASPAAVAARSGTPRPNGAANDAREPNSSRANSALPDQGFMPPAQAAEHGDHVRSYLNTKVVPSLLVGVKQVAKDKPVDPLRVLGEYLLQCSRELEGEAQSNGN